MKKCLAIAMLTVVLVCAFSACMQTKGDPIETIKKLNEKNYSVEVIVNDEEIADLADDVEIKSEGIYLIVVAVPNDSENGKMGLAFYCNSNDIAKELEEDLRAYLNKEKNNNIMETFVRGTVECEGSVVFMGCEDVWQVMQ